MAELIEDPKKKKASFGDAAAAATDGAVTQAGALPAASQIPNGSPAGWAGGAVSPASQPMSVDAGAMPGTRAVMSGFADDAKTMLGKGQYGALAGQLGRATAAMPLAIAEDVLRPAVGLATPVFQGAANAIKTFATGDAAPATLGAIQSPVAAQPGAVQPVAKPAVAAPDIRVNAAPIAASDAALPPAAPVPAVAAGAIAPPAQTDGQRVMDMDNRMADQMRAERMALEATVPQAQVRNSTNDWAARKNLENMKTEASSIMNKTGGRGGVSPAVAAYQAALAHDLSLQGGATPADINNTNVAQQNAALQATQGNEALRLKQSSAQFGANQDIAKQRLALDGRKADIADAGSRMDNETKAQLQGLNAQILKETDPSKLAVLQDKAQTITGKYQRPDPAARDVFGAIAGGTDAMGNKTDPIIYNKQTGESAKAQVNKPAYPEGTRLTGPDKKPYIVKNGVPVPV